MSKSLSHFNARGEAHMVDVSGKQPSHRIAVAEGRIQMQAATLERILEGDTKKGDVLGVARVAGIMAAKKTPDLIPLCHPLALNHVDIQFTPDKEKPGIICQATVETYGVTGVEMEALTAVHISLLTIYDMCKAVDRKMVTYDIRLISKSGGKSGDWCHTETGSDK